MSYLQVNYHIDEYKEIRDWNRNQSGGHNRECEFFEVLDEALRTRDIVNFSDVLGAGFQRQEQDSEEAPKKVSPKQLTVRRTDEREKTLEEELFGDSDDERGDEIGNLADRAAEKSFRIISSKTARDGEEKLQKSGLIKERESRKRKPKKRTPSKTSILCGSHFEESFLQQEGILLLNLGLKLS